MLSADELDRIADRFGVDETQVRRDHLISHLLAALSAELPDAVLFFGGTALARGYLPDGRLSEDIDLIARGRRRDVATAVESVFRQALRREFPGLAWDPPPTRVRDVQSAVLTTSDGLMVRVQILDPAGYPAWPTDFRELEQRYADAPPARLTIPTRPAFAAWKTVAWGDRRASRDLYDLWLLAGVGGIDEEATRLYARFGPTNRAPAPALFERGPDADAWRRDLAGQTRLAVAPAEALVAVRESWRAARG